MFRFFRAEMYRLSKDKNFKFLILFLLISSVFGVLSLKFLNNREMEIDFFTVILITISTLVSAPFIILMISQTTYFNRDNENTALAIGTGVSRYEISFVSLFTTFILSVLSMVFAYGVFILLSLIFLPISFQLPDMILLLKAIMYGVPLFCAYICWIYLFAGFFKNKNTFFIAFTIYQLTIPNLLNLFMYYFEWSKKIITNIMSYQLQNLKNFYRIVENNIYNPLRISIVGLAWLIVGIVIILIMNYKREYDIKN